VPARRALEQFGAEVRGYRAPSWDTSERTTGLARADEIARAAALHQADHDRDRSGRSS
jgi:hypothetical protein